MNWLRDKIEERIKQYEFENEIIYYDEYRYQRLLEAREILSLLDQSKCKNCKLLKIWVEKQGDLEDNIYSCNYMECQNIEEDYCSNFEPKDL